MDEDYIYLDRYDYTKLVSSDRFYMTGSNNDKFINMFIGIIGSDDINGVGGDPGLLYKIIKNIEDKRKETISEISIDAISYAANAHNFYAKGLGINYEFAFTTEDAGMWYESINGIGMMAMVQGISLGNRYLNYKAYSISSLILSKKYYLSSGITDDTVDNTYLEHKLYHSTDKCPIYKEYIFRMMNNYSLLSPKFYLAKSEAAENGYYPCPICNP